MTFRTFFQRMGLAALVGLAAWPDGGLRAQENPMFFHVWQPMSRTAGTRPIVIKSGAMVRRGLPDYRWEVIKDFGNSFVARGIPSNVVPNGEVFEIYWFAIKHWSSTIHHKTYVLEFSDCSLFLESPARLDDSSMATLWRDLQKPDRKCSFSEDGPRFKQGGWGRASFSRDVPWDD